jgi:hypothetical protein
MTNSPDRGIVSGGQAEATSSEGKSSGSEFTELERARNEALNVVQWLARVACSYVTNGDPERRLDLDYHAVEAAVVTKNFADGVALEMRLPDLHLQFLHNGKPAPHVFDPQERSPAEAEAWILVELLHRGIDREKFSKQLPYSVPGLLTGDAEDYAPGACRSGLTELAGWFDKAASVFTEAMRLPGAEKPVVSCLPRTLDLAVAAPAGAKRPLLGFSFGDTQHSEPYFYAAGPANSPKVERRTMSAAKLLAATDIAETAALLTKLAL